MAHKKSRDIINDIPVCPHCEKPTDKNCYSHVVVENGKRLHKSLWKCHCCNKCFSANIDLDSGEDIESVNDLVKPLATGCLYDVRFRVIRPEDYYTPMMYLPIERIRIEYKSGLTDGYMLCVPVGNELDINPDHIRIEDFQPCR